ncbi:MAG: hypothetical protein QME62_10435 [Armatimonadota bacterium]|nr:hypothetical protein [Armatimonadota bacterium]
MHHKNVVIYCTSITWNLGIAIPTCLTWVEGRPIIHHQLDLFEDYHNVVVVAGFKAAQIMQAILSRREDAVFAINHDFETATDMDMLRLGAAAFDEPFISLDGSLILTKEALELIEAAACPSIGIRKVRSLEPICVDLEIDGQQKIATGFTKELRTHELAGIAKLHPQHIMDATDASHIYQSVERLLPVPAIEIDSAALETDINLETAEERIGRRILGAALLRGLAGA